MTEPNDPFDNWLHNQVEPLSPPPGTYDRIRKRAKQRKMRRALMSAASAGAAAALIVVAVVAVPKLVPALHSTPRDAANSTQSTPKVSAGPATTPSRLAPSSSAPSYGNAATTVPADFAPTSVTFMNSYTGWVIGQAPGCGKTYCTSVAETSNYGQSWKPVPAPPAGAPDGSTGVSQIRFLDAENGWAFGPQLYVTHDGGQSWQEIDTHGMRVTGLETVGAVVYAVFAKCSGSGSDFAADCTHVSVYSSAADSNLWTAMPDLSDLGFTSGYVSGKIVLTPGAGYFYSPTGYLYTGPVSQSASWGAAYEPVPCQPSTAQPNGQPSNGQLAASTTSDLVVACPAGSGSSKLQIYTSTDGGTLWQSQGTLTVKGTATSLADAINGVLTLATTGGIYVSTTGGQTWKLGTQGPPGGFSFVGMTNATLGVAVPANPAQSNSVWITRDGGASWQQSSLTNP